MPADSEYGDDIRMLDDLTRLKIRLIDRRLHHHHASPRIARARTPDPVHTPPLYPERRRDRFYRKLDRRNEILQKLWEELGNGGGHYRRSLPPLTPHPMNAYEPQPWMDEQLWNKTGNTKKDLMELMLIQNSQMQQWMMTQTLQRQAAGADGTGVHHHYHDPSGRMLPPIKRADAGSQYPQDFFHDGSGSNTRERTRESRGQQASPQKGRRRKRR